MDTTDRMRAALRGKRVRVGKEQSGAALLRPGARIMEMNGRRYEGYVRVDPERCEGRALGEWLALAEKYVATLPSKSSGWSASFARAGR